MDLWYEKIRVPQCRFYHNTQYKFPCYLIPGIKQRFLSKYPDFKTWFPTIRVFLLDIMPDTRDFQETSLLSQDFYYSSWKSWVLGSIFHSSTQASFPTINNRTNQMIERQIFAGSFSGFHYARLSSYTRWDGKPPHLSWMKKEGCPIYEMKTLCSRRHLTNATVREAWV